MSTMGPLGGKTKSCEPRAERRVGTKRLTSRWSDAVWPSEGGGANVLWRANSGSDCRCAVLGRTQLGFLMSYA
eukprot:scaffold68237_cov69-Phaeocystis_antarctica.AAC.2